MIKQVKRISLLVLLFVYPSISVLAQNIDFSQYRYKIEEFSKLADWQGLNNFVDNIIKKYPEESYPYLHKCIALDELGEYDSALKYCSKHIQMTPNSAAGYQNRGLVYFDKEDYDNAILDYDKAYEISPENEIIKEQREMAKNAKKGIVVTTEGSATTIQSIKDPFYLAEKYMYMPKKIKNGIINSVKSYSSEVLPLYYIAVADDVYTEEKDLAAFLYLIGIYRSSQDVLMCKDESAYDTLYGLSYIAPKTSEYLDKISKSKMGNLYKKILEWDTQYPNRPNPEWICYHGIETFKNQGQVEILPLKEYKQKQEEVRQIFMKFVQDSKN